MTTSTRSCCALTARSCPSGNSSCPRPSPLARPAALLDDVLAPYRTAAEHALTLVRDPEHNGESSHECLAVSTDALSPADGATARAGAASARTWPTACPLSLPCD